MPDVPESPQWAKWRMPVRVCRAGQKRTGWRPLPWGLHIALQRGKLQLGAPHELHPLPNFRVR